MRCRYTGFLKSASLWVLIAAICTAGMCVALRRREGEKVGERGGSSRHRTAIAWCDRWYRTSTAWCEHGHGVVAVTVVQVVVPARTSASKSNPFSRSS